MKLFYSDFPKNTREECYLLVVFFSKMFLSVLNSENQGLGLVFKPLQSNKKNWKKFVPFGSYTWLISNPSWGNQEDPVSRTKCVLEYSAVLQIISRLVWDWMLQAIPPTFTSTKDESRPKPRPAMVKSAPPVVEEATGTTELTVNRYRTLTEFV